MLDLPFISGEKESETVFVESLEGLWSVYTTLIENGVNGIVEELCDHFHRTLERDLVGGLSWRGCLFHHLLRGECESICIFISIVNRKKANSGTIG